MLDFNYAVSTKIFFGKGKLDRLPLEIKKYSDRILLVYGCSHIKKSGLYDRLVKILAENNIVYKELAGVKPNPRIKTVVKGVALCREHKLKFILAVGGGSVIDCAKAVAFGVFYPGNPWDFFSQELAVKQALPLATVLTLAASGSEMNGYTVISNELTKEKFATGGDVLRPKFSVLDPSRMFSLPKKQTAAGVIDIYSHVLEQYFSPTSEVFLQDRLAEAILKTCIHYGPLALTEPKNYSVRANLMWAGSLALNGLLGFGKVSDWATHMIEHAVSAVYDLTHGIGLAIIAPHWMEYVLSDISVDKFAEYAKNVWGLKGENNLELAKQGISETRNFFNSLGLPKALSEVGIKESELPVLASKATAFGNIGEFRKLNQDDVLAILKAAF